MSESPQPPDKAPDSPDGGAPPPGTAGLVTVRPPGRSDRVGPANLTHAEVRRIFIGLTLSIFLAALDQTIIAAPLPTIGRELGDFENLPWVVTAYLLTSTAVAPLYGKLSDRYGRRTMILIGLSIFTLGSIAAALAPTMLVLIVGRALQGLGGGGLLPLSQTIIADVVTARERGRYQAYTGIAWVGAGIAGPMVGGMIAEHLHWSLVFWINLPIGVIAIAVADRALRRLPRRTAPHRLDILGAVLLMASASPFMLALSWGGKTYPWASPQIVGLVVLALGVAALFTWRMRTAAEPFLPIPILANKVVRRGTLAATCTLGTAIGITIIVPLYLESVHGLAAGAAGLALMPMVAMSTPGALVSGRVMQRARHYKIVPIVGLSGSILLFAFLAFHPGLTLTPAIAVLTVASLGFGTVYPVTTVSVQNAVAPPDVGIATGAMNFFRSLGSALITAVMGAIVLAGLGAAPPHRGAAAVNPHGAPAAPLDAAPDQLLHTFGVVFAAAAGFLVLALAALLLMEERELHGPAPPSVVSE